ncbi:ABC transporter substrate-binding protein [Alteromonas sp. ASW11-36]|uniref:ABC transporter substrate-binding protein n=1 Tax=Alteromonas arenosi TaxID=3055817 RepID=A0ABT7SSS9_9ALTE|nr:ABC transporter substrate-binding protein [Alteromonas sp. ASW11-36]MDM7859039.1 ABC transporter substrate-binding protein [Alteromonas sp. ASW11-36]
MLFLSILLCSCQPKDRLEPVTIVIGSWYGFYPFYYAIEHGIDRQVGIRLKIVEPNNIGNFRRGYMRQQVDFGATSMIEFTNAHRMSQIDIRPVIFTDYSNGGDVIVATRSIQSLADLEGARIAVPSQGIAEYILSLVFDDPVPSNHFAQFKIPEDECADAFKEDLIDACVTYPPMSTFLLENPDLHQIYTTAEHPRRVFDVVWAKPHVSDDLAEKMLKLWFVTLEKVKADPISFYQFVAKIADVPTAAVSESMQGIELLDEGKHREFVEDYADKVKDIVTACQVAKNPNCAQYGEMFEELN